MPMSGEPKATVETGRAIGNYSSAVVAGDFCFVSGQAALDESGKGAFGDLRAQVATTIQNMKAVLEAAGYGLSDVVKVTCYLSNLDDWTGMDEVFGRYFPENPPARVTIEASLIYGCLVEMDCVAWRARPDPP